MIDNTQRKKSNASRCMSGRTRGRRDTGTRGQFFLTASPRQRVYASVFFVLLMIGDLAAEKGGADPDHGRALGDGHLEVVAHAHADVAETGAADLVPSHFLEDLARPGER